MLGRSQDTSVLLIGELGSPILRTLCFPFKLGITVMARHKVQR